MQFGYLLAAAIPSVAATRNCRSCVPLHDLLSPAYGLAITADGLSSAIAFHNGSSEPLARIVGSDEYLHVMNRTLSDALTKLSPKTRSTWCHEHLSPLSEGDDYLHLDPPSLWSSLARLWPRHQTGSVASPLSESAKLFRLHMERLLSLNSRPANLTISLVVPSYLVGTQLECDIRSAASSLVRTIVAVDYPPAATFTAYGYDMCRESSEWLSCNAPGRMLTLEMAGRNSHIVVASFTVSAILDNVASAVFDLSANSSGLSLWLDDLVKTYRPDMVAHIGPEGDRDRLTDGIANSKAGELLIDQSIRAAGDAAVVGAAQTAKEALDRIVSDCIEDTECDEIRRKADEIAGPYRPPGQVASEQLGLDRHIELK